MKQKMIQKAANVTTIPEVHLPDAPCGGTSNYSGCTQVNRVDNKINK